jgi:nucleoside-diphosphate-sugar epimerase
MPTAAKKILILGNLGYIGPVLVRHLRAVWPQSVLVGYDAAFFQGCLLDCYQPAEPMLDQQLYGDVRTLDPQVLAGVEAVVALAAVSNDPMGLSYEKPTREINTHAIVDIAHKAKQAGVKNFVFASSCSVYGAGGDKAKDERAEVNPLTAYAISKIECERGLAPLAGDGFTIRCLRFATACGPSPRLRLDLVLNDFVASALATRQIQILSDGTPWRPLIDVRDMCRAMEWAMLQAGQLDFLTLNVGSAAWNFRIKELAHAVAAHIGGVTVSVNPDAAPDKRSYQVDFSLFRSLAPDHQPLQKLGDTIGALVAALQDAGFADANFRQSHLIRLNSLNMLKQRGRIDADLHWIQG